MIDNYNVKGVFLTPTALRAIKKEDPTAIQLQKARFETLKSVHIAGERLDPDTFIWFKKHLKNQDILVNDNWW